MHQFISLNIKTEYVKTRAIAGNSYMTVHKVGGALSKA